MSSYTPADIRNMVDDFDALVRQAVEKGNIEDVFTRQRETLDKIFRIRKDTGLKEAVKKEFEVDRFLWVFSQNWRKAKKANGLDSYWDGVKKMMENFDQENPTGRRMVSTTTTNVAAKVTSANADTRNDPATTPTPDVSPAIASSANDRNDSATKEAGNVSGAGNVPSAKAQVDSANNPKDSAFLNPPLSTTKLIFPIAKADVTSATAKVASANDHRTSAKMNEPANNNKTSATKLQAIDHHSHNPPPSTSKSISPIAQYTPLLQSSVIEDFSVIGEPITFRKNLLSNELKPTRPHYMPLNFQSSATPLLLSNRPGYKRTRSKSPTPGPSRPRVLMKTTSRRSSTISSLSTPRDPSPPSDYNPKMITPIWPPRKPVAYDSDNDPEYLPSIKVKHIGNKGKEKEEVPKREETGTKRKRKSPQATGNVNDKPCKRCVEKNLTCFSQYGGNACLNCAKVKLKCEDGQYKRQRRTMKPADEKKASAIPPKASAVRQKAPAIPPKASAIPPKSSAIPPKPTTGIPTARPAPPAPDAKPRTRARKPAVPTSGTREERKMYTSVEKGKEREKNDDRIEDLKQEVDRLRKLVDSIVPAYIRLSETAADLEKEVRGMKTEFQETTRHQERFLNVLNDRYHDMMSKFDEDNVSDSSKAMPMRKPVPVERGIRYKRPDGIWVNDWLAMEPEYREKVKEEEREKKLAEEHDVESGDGSEEEDAIVVEKVAETQGKVDDADEDANEIEIVEGVADKKKTAEEEIEVVEMADIRMVEGVADEKKVAEEEKKVEEVAEIKTVADFEKAADADEDANEVAEIKKVANVEKAADADEDANEVAEIKKVANVEKVADADEDTNETEVVEGMADKKVADIKMVAENERDVVEDKKVADAQVRKVADEVREVVEEVAGTEVSDAIVADDNIVQSVARIEKQVVDDTQLPPSPSSAPLPPNEMPPPLPPSTPTVTLQPPTPQTSQEDQTAMPTTLLGVPIQDTTREEITKSRSRSSSVAVEDLRRSPRLKARSLSPLPSSLPVKRPPDAAEDKPESKRARKQ